MKNIIIYLLHFYSKYNSSYNILSQKKHKKEAQNTYNLLYKYFYLKRFVHLI